MQTSRRNALTIGGLTALGAALGAGYLFRSPQDPLLPYIKPDVWWQTEDLTTFLEHLNDPQQKLVLLSLKKENSPFDVTQIKKDVRWSASHVTTYPFRDKTGYHYHDEILKWLAGEFQIRDEIRFGLPSLALERRIFEAVVGELWKDLSVEQRKEVLLKADIKGNHDNLIGGASLAGAAGLSTLSIAVNSSGFAFYTAMSSIIHSTAALAGITVPFAGYMGASSTVAFLSGPVGWSLLALAGLASVFFLGRADHIKTAAFVIQVHLLKVQALENSGRLDLTMDELGRKFKAYHLTP